MNVLPNSSLQVNKASFSLVMPQPKSIRLPIKLILLLIIISVVLILAFVGITLTFNKYSQNLIQLGDVYLIYDKGLHPLIIELVPAKNTSLTLAKYSLTLPINRTCLPREGVDLDLSLKYGEPLHIVCLGEFRESYDEPLVGKITIYINQSIEDHTFTVKHKKIGCMSCPTNLNKK